MRDVHLNRPVKQQPSKITLRLWCTYRNTRKGYICLRGIKIQAHCKGQPLAAQYEAYGFVGGIGAAHKHCFKGLPHTIACLGAINHSPLGGQSRTSRAEHAGLAVGFKHQRQPAVFFQLSCSAGIH